MHSPSKGKKHDTLAGHNPSMLNALIEYFTVVSVIFAYWKGQQTYCKRIKVNFHGLKKDKSVSVLNFVDK